MSLPLQSHNVPPLRHSLSHHLKEWSIHFFKPGTMQVSILETLVRSLPIIHYDTALTQILKREEMGSTLINSRVSVPHARIDGLKSIVAALGLHSDGLQAADNKINVFALFL